MLSPVVYADQTKLTDRPNVQYSSNKPQKHMALLNPTLNTYGPSRVHSIRHYEDENILTKVKPWHVLS